ncbi:hypothetical protein [Mucilaginibacter conchicola]|nr:hypothetical protein [Mucilaginibacter conchicola]
MMERLRMEFMIRRMCMLLAENLAKLSACDPLSEAYGAEVRQLIREQVELQHLIISALRCYVEDDPQLIALFEQGVHDMELLGLLRSNQIILQENQ